MVNVVILGGGFAGVRAALTLKNKEESHDIHVVLIDQNNFHVFTPALYEVATAEESQRNIVIPYHIIFKSSIELVQGIVRGIDSQNQRVILDSKKEYKYDYLIFALGSNTAYFDIPGVKEYGIPLKTLEDAKNIKNALRNISGKKIVVGGGGFSGTELACELTAHKGDLDITVIQGSQILLKELGKGVSGFATKRLQERNVRLILGQHIKKVTKNEVEVENGEIYPYNIFIWTGGVRSNVMLGKIEIDNFLKVKDHKNIFAVGDAVVPGVAPKAQKMGKVAAENILRIIKNESLIPFDNKHIGYVIPLGNHFATFAMGKYHISGIFAYILQQLIFLRYLLHILPFFEAMKRFRRFEKDLAEN